MPSAGTLYVDIAARTEKLTKGLDTARVKIAKFSKIAIGGTLAAGTAAAAAATAAATAAYREMAPAIDRAAKASDRLAISTESLTSLAHAANLSGSSMEGLVKGLTLMLKNLGDAKMGTGEAVVALERLGLSAKELSGLGADAAFVKIADAINKLPTAADKTVVAMKIFGRSGADLLPLMQEGATGIREMMEDARRLGTTFTREQARMVEAANDAGDRLGAAFSGIKTQLTIALAPAIQATTDKLTQWVSSLNAGGGAAGKFTGAMTQLGKAVGFIADVVHFAQGGFYKMQLAVTKVFEFLAKAVAKAVSEAIRLVNKLPGVNINDSGGFLTALADELGNTTGGLQKKIDDIMLGPAPSAKINAFFDDIEQRAKQAAAATGEAVRNVALPPAVEGVLQKFGGLLARSSELPGKAGGAVASAIAGLKSKEGGITPAFALTRSGSAESYRQQAAIRREGETQKLGRQQLKEQKRTADGIEQLIKQGMALLPANL